MVHSSESETLTQRRGQRRDEGNNSRLWKVSPFETQISLRCPHIFLPGVRCTVAAEPGVAVAVLGTLAWNEKKMFVVFHRP